MPSYVFYCKFDQDIFKNSCSGKSLSDIKEKDWQQNITWYVNSHGFMLIMLFVKKLYLGFKQMKVQNKYILKDFLLCYLFKVLANKHWLTW